MDSYKVRVSDINPDFSWDPEPVGTWLKVCEHQDDLVLLLNRIAIATTQGCGAEPPVAEITWGSQRVRVQVLNGFLYYSDLACTSRSNLKILAEEVVSLLSGEQTDAGLQGYQAVADQERSCDTEIRYRANSHRGRFFLLVACCAVTAFCGYLVLNALLSKPLLVGPPPFTSQEIAGDSLLSDLCGVYVSDFRDGGYVCEIHPEGDFVLYEMWRLERRAGFVLVVVETLALLEGMHYDAPALLAGGVRLIRPLKDGDISMQNIRMMKYAGSVKEIGEIIESGKP